MPAGTLIFPADSKTAKALDAAGQQGGMWFERNVGVAMPKTSVVADAPKIAILVNSVPSSGADTDGCLDRIFGAANVKYVATVNGAASLENSSTNPLNGFNVIYNAGGSWPSSAATIASNLPATIRSTGATESGTTVTITMASGTTLPGTLKVGSSVTIAGVGVAGYNGTFTVASVPSATTFTYTNPTSGLANSGNGTVTSTDVVAGASETGDTVTITMGSAYLGSITTGSSVTIAGVGVAGYNGTFTVTGTPSASQFTYTNPTTGLADSGGGTVTSADVNALAKTRLSAFFAHGGGYIATSTSTSGFSFLSSAIPALVAGSLTQGSQSAYGGIAQWANVAGANSPISGAYPSIDTMFLPANTTYFSAIPSSDVTVDAQYPANIATIGPANGFLSGMWLNRDAAANNAPVLVHGSTTAGSRYVAYATNPFSRYDAEREWPLIVQAALWSDLKDEGQIAFTVTATAGANGSVTPSGATTVAVGNDETYTIKPNAGYHVADVLVDGSSVGAVTTYTFKNVAEDHTISATFAVSPAWKISFSLSKTSVKVNTKVRFYGAVSSDGTPATGSVKIQRKKSGGSWATWRTASLNAAGKYSITVKMTSKATWYFRTMKAGDSDHAKTYSRERKLRVH